MNDDLEELLARLKPRGVQPELRPQVLAAVTNELQAIRGKAPPCDNPGGHQFVCVHCGSDARRGIGAARWAWPGALAAMTSVAAVLLVMLLANRDAQVADRGSQSVATNPTKIPSSSAQDKRATSRDRATALREGRGDMEELGLWRRIVASRQADGRRILSAGDTELRDDLFAQNDLPSRQSAASTFDIESADARLRNGALMRRMLRESGVGGRAIDPSLLEPWDLPGSRL